MHTQLVCVCVCAVELAYKSHHILCDFVLRTVSGSVASKSNQYFKIFIAAGTLINNTHPDDRCIWIAIFEIVFVISFNIRTFGCFIFYIIQNSNNNNKTCAQSIAYDILCIYLYTFTFNLVITSELVNIPCYNFVVVFFHCCVFRFSVRYTCTTINRCCMVWAWAIPCHINMSLDKKENHQQQKSKQLWSK